MVKRHLKSLMDLVRKRARHEGSMVKGYMVYQIMVYITQFLSKIDASINVDHIWDVNSINRFEGER